MSAVKNSGVDARAYLQSRSSNTTSWSDLDKTRLYSIGTGMYSGLTVLLHPLTVLKIRRQTGSIIENAGTTNLRQYYRGLGVVLSMAIPARILYISTLEYTRESAEHIATNLILNPPPYFPINQNQLQSFLPLVTPFSGGLAGGLAALSSQLIVVPMDVISQKQMVSENPISAKDLTRTIISSDGYKGLFRGFGLSLFTSLPAGSIWWATYAGAKDQLSKMNFSFGIEAEAALPILETAKSGTIQVASAFSAAIAAAVVTQPLDTIKTRLQVLGSTSGTSFVSITKELASTGKLYQGLLPRIAHMGIWGSVLSAAYEYLKVVSRKDA